MGLSDTDYLFLQKGPLMFGDVSVEPNERTFEGKINITRKSWVNARSELLAVLFCLPVLIGGGGVPDLGPDLDGGYPPSWLMT